MIPHDHDYEGKDRSEHQMQLNAYFDGELIWLWMRGAHSWQDGCYSHNWTHAMLPKTFSDIVMVVTNAIDLYHYLTEVVPCFAEEWGDVEMFEYNGYKDLGS